MKTKLKYNVGEIVIIKEGYHIGEIKQKIIAETNSILWYAVQLGISMRPMIFMESDILPLNDSTIANMVADIIS